MHILRHQWSQLARNAWHNRQELIAAGLTSRRDLLKMGLLSGTGMLILKHGLSSRVADAKDIKSPKTREFLDPLPIMPVKRPLANGIDGLYPPPTIWPNNAGGEGRTRPHQAFLRYPGKFPFPPQKVFDQEVREVKMKVSPDLPDQWFWSFDGSVPGVTLHAKYGEDMLVRRRNKLPADNLGFGVPQTITHLHNGHSPSESDGFTYDFFPNPMKPECAYASFYDYHYPNVLAGFASTHAPDGDVREAMSTLWYHDHRVGFTSQNVYKGLAAFYLMFNHLDNGNENDPSGFRLPGVRDPADFYGNVQYDIPLMLTDRLFDPSTGKLYFDLFEQDGILGDKFLVNGKIQPYMVTEPRRYRFRVLAGGPSRFYQLFLTDKAANTAIPFWHVATDGNLLPKPIKVTSLNVVVAQRADIVIDFKAWAGKTLYFENRLVQTDGRGADYNIGAPLALKAAGTGNFILQFRVGTAAVADNSVDFEAEPGKTFYELPPVTAKPRLTRNFKFERTNGQWLINGKRFPDTEEVVNFRVKQDSAEVWNLRNSSGGWMHPAHIHMEEHRLLKRNGRVILPGDVEYARRDVTLMQHSEQNSLAFQFRDWEGPYLFHCHNTLHEDHAMMLRFDVDATGDLNKEP
jgi:FtsP/CotA-like multicopper oxidase with cupredoxin domain